VDSEIEEIVERLAEETEQEIKRRSNLYGAGILLRFWIKAGIRVGIAWAFDQVQLELVCPTCKRGLTGKLGDTCFCGAFLVIGDAQLRPLTAGERLEDSNGKNG
jgi:hypothetical protein